MLRLPETGSKWVGRLKWLGLLSLLALGATGCSRGRNNPQIASDVQDRIRTDSRMQMARVQVIATDGVITLSGYVASPEQRAAMVRDAAQIKGVRIVIDNLRVVDPNPQSPAIAVQKPPASISWPVDRPSGRPEAPVDLNTAISHPITPAPADRASIGQTMGAGRASGAIANSTSVPAAPVSREVQAIDTKAVGTTAIALPVTALPVPSPAPAVRPATPEQVTLPYGTELAVRLTESLSSERNEKGDTFLASLASPIMIGDRIVIPAEAGVEGKVVDVQSAGRFSGRPQLAVEMTRLTCNGKTYELRSSQYSKQGASRDTRSIATIGGSAGVGAIIGAILGGGRGAAIGSIIGAGAGTGAQATSKPAEVKLPAESVLSFRLQTPLTVIPSSSLQMTQHTGPGSQQDPLSSDDDRPVLKRRPGSPPPDTEAADATPHSDNK